VFLPILGILPINGWATLLSWSSTPTTSLLNEAPDVNVVERSNFARDSHPAGGPGSQATNLLLRQHGDDSNVGLFME
jgi:hypothetical protein